MPFIILISLQLHYVCLCVHSIEDNTGFHFKYGREVALALDFILSEF